MGESFIQENIHLSVAERLKQICQDVLMKLVVSSEKFQLDRRNLALTPSLLPMEMALNEF